MLIPKKESDKIEFKPVLNNAVIEALVAFSNAKGGTVYVGVADNSRVSGVSLGQETLPQFINEVKNKTSPSIIPDSEVIDVGGGKKVVVLSITEYPIKPVSFQGKYYRRVNASNHLLNANEVANIYLQTMNTSWDFYPHPNTTIDDISLEKVRKAMNVIKKRNENFQIDSEIEFLEKNRLLLPDNSVTNGCFLMFSREENFRTTILMGHFASEIVIKDDVVNSEDILTQIDSVMDFVRKHISKALIITDTQVENIQRWQYPLDGIRELVLNMIIHRDYTAVHNSIIKIFPDRIQFFNPGILPDTITLEQLQTNQYVSTPRNRQVAKFVKDMGLVEHFGTGIKRVQKMFVDYGLKSPLFEVMSGGLSVTVYGVEDESVEKNEESVEKSVEKNVKSREKSEESVEKTGKSSEKSVKSREETGKSSEKSVKSREKTGKSSEKSVKSREETGKSSEKSVKSREKTGKSSEKSVKSREKNEKSSEKILQLISDNPNITQKELSLQTELSRQAIEKNLKTLKVEGLIERVGPDKGGYWRVIS